MSKQAGISISLAALFAIIILVFGIFIFSKLMNTTRSAVSKAQIQQFKTTLYSDLETLSSQREASQDKALPVAEQVRAVCFVGSNASSFCEDVPATDIYYEYEKSICNFLKISKYESKDNIFFFPQNTHFYVDGIHVKNILCIPASESSIKLHISVSKGKSSIEEYNPYEKSKKNNPFIEPKKLKQPCSSTDDCEVGLTCQNHICVSCTSNENCSDDEICSDGECTEIVCSGNVPINSYSCDGENITFCNLTSPHNVTLEEVKDCLNDEGKACSSGTCNPPDKEITYPSCKKGDDWTFFYISTYSNYNSSIFGLSNSIPCSDLNPDEIGNITCDNGNIDTSQCKKDYMEIPLGNDPAMILLGKDVNGANTFAYIFYVNGTVDETHNLGRVSTSGISHLYFYDNSGCSNSKIIITFTHRCKNSHHFNRCGREKIKSVKLSCGEVDINDWLSKYLCGYNSETACSKKTNPPNSARVNKLCLGRGEVCYKIKQNNSCSKDSCSTGSYLTDDLGNKLVVSLSADQNPFSTAAMHTNPFDIMKDVLSHFFNSQIQQNKISKFCCSGSGSSSSTTSSGRGACAHKGGNCHSDSDCCPDYHCCSGTCQNRC